MLLALGLTATAAARAQFPPNPPAPLPLRPAVYPAAQETVLPNGLRLVVLESHRQPIVAVTLSLPAGTAYDPPGKEGVADLLAALVTRGAGPRSGPEIADLLERIGGSLSASATPDYLTLQADILTPQTETALGLLADLVLRPHLDSAEFEAQRAQRIAALQNELSSQGAVTARIFLMALYGGHPYGARATPGTLRGITRGDLEAFRRARFRPNGAVLLMAGDVTLARARQLATRAFAGWSGAAPAPLPPPNPGKAPTGILLVHNPGAERANILVGNTTGPGSDTVLYAGLVAARILGDEDGRLVRHFQSARGWSDIAFASLLRTRQLGLFQAGVEVPEPVADSALADLLGLLWEIRREVVPFGELEGARGALVDGYPFAVQTVSQLASQVTEARQLGMPAAFVASFRQRVAAVTAARVREAARRLIKPDSALVVVVGDGARLHARLAKLAPVKLVSLQGTQLKPEDIQPRTRPLVIDPARLAPQRDSLLVMAQGRPVGRQVYALEAAGDGFTYTERTDIGQMISQITRLAFDSAGRPRRLEQSGRVQGQETRIELTYGGGRVRGTARVPGPDGPRTIQVDTAVGPAVLDDNALQPLLPALEWGPNVRWTFEVFSGGENRVKPASLTVVSIERVPLGAGEVETYRAVLEGGQSRVTFYVTTASPHRLVRVSLSGTPIEFIAEHP
jgi:zinc protease